HSSVRLSFSFTVSGLALDVNSFPTRRSSDLTATNTGTGIVTTVISNEAGAYQFASLQLGTYDIKADLTGFQPAVAKAFQLGGAQDRKSTRLNSSHSQISYAVFCLKKKKAQMIIADENAGKAKTFVDAHEIGRGIDVDAHARRFQNCAQVGNRRALSIAAGDMDHRR